MFANVDKLSCNGCGLCPEVCPELFSLGKDGLAGVSKEPIPPELQESCLHAAGSCPVEAITIHAQPQ